MTGRRRTSTTTPRIPRSRRIRPVRTALLSAGALAVCGAVAVGCGAVPGVMGGGGDTVTVMTWAPQDTSATNKPGMPAMAQAYARWVNAHGGLGGRTLKVLVCNDHNSAADAAACARRAADEHVVAVVGSYSQHSDSFLGPLESAGIPYLGGYGLTKQEFKSPLSYPVNGGEPALLAGLGEELGRSCGRVALVRPDTIAGDELAVPFNAGLKASGHAAATDVRAAEGATAYDDQAKQALETVTGGTGGTTGASGKGCVVPVLGERTDTFVDSFRRVRADYPEVRTASVLGSVDQSVVDAAGGASGAYEGAYATSWYPVASDARWNTMKKVIKDNAFGDNRIDAADAGVQTTWLAYTALRQVVRSLGDGEVTARAVQHALDGGLKVTTGGLTPTLSWRFEDLAAVIDYPRLVNSDVTYQVVREGRLVSARKGFVNVSKTLETPTSS